MFYTALLSDCLVKWISEAFSRPTPLQCYVHQMANFIAVSRAYNLVNASYAQCFIAPIISIIIPHPTSCYSFLNLSFSSSLQSFSSGSLPLVSFAVLANAGLPAYSCWTGACCSFSIFIAIGWFPLNRFRISIIPRLHSPRPCFSC